MAAAAEWLVRYADELGRAPVCAEHLQAFVAHRGGHLPYRSALEAVVQASGRPLDQMAQHRRYLAYPRQLHAPEGSAQRRSSDRTRGTAEAPAAAAAAAWIAHPSRQPELSDRTLAMQRLFALGARQREGASDETLRGFLSADSSGSSSSENIEASIRRFLMAFEQEVQAVAEVEISRLLAALPAVNKSARHRECSICMEASEDGDSAEEEECGDSSSNQDEHEDPSAKGWVGLPCAHIYHEDCLRRWFRQSVHKRTCPLCRLDLGSLGVGTCEGHTGATSIISSVPTGENHVVESPEPLSSGTQ